MIVISSFEGTKCTLEAVSYTKCLFYLRLGYHSATALCWEAGSATRSMLGNGEHRSCPNFEHLEAKERFLCEPEPPDPWVWRVSAGQVSTLQISCWRCLPALPQAVPPASGAELGLLGFLRELPQLLLFFFLKKIPQHLLKPYCSFICFTEWPSQMALLSKLNWLRTVCMKQQSRRKGIYYCCLNLA